MEFKAQSKQRRVSSGERCPSTVPFPDQLAQELPACSGKITSRWSSPRLPAPDCVREVRGRGLLSYLSGSGEAYPITPSSARRVTGSMVPLLLLAPLLSALRTWSSGRTEESCCLQARGMSVGGTEGKREVKAETKPKQKTTSSQISIETHLLAPQGPGIPSGRRGGQEAATGSGFLPGTVEAWLGPLQPALGGDATATTGPRPLLSRSCPRALLKRFPRSGLLLLGLFFPICFSPCYVPGFDFQREFP